MLLYWEYEEEDSPRGFKGQSGCVQGTFEPQSHYVAASSEGHCSCDKKTLCIQNGEVMDGRSWFNNTCTPLSVVGGKRLT